MIINPNAQGGSLGRRWPFLAKILRRELGSFAELHTQGPGDATRLTREALLEGKNLIIAVGGDGTVNETINGFFKDGQAVSEQASLGIIPFGTGGDFRRSLGIPNDVSKAAEILSTGRAQTIDVGFIEYTTRNSETEQRAFLNIASFGIGGLVDEIVNKSNKRLGGKVGFFLATAKAQFSYQNQRVRLIFDGDEAGSVENTIHSVAVANGRYFGGGMHMAPNAKLNDGQFDIVSLGDWKLGDTLRHSRRIYAGTHLELPQVSLRRAQELRAEPLCNTEVKLDIDGETPGILPARFWIKPSAVQVIAPAL